MLRLLCDVSGYRMIEFLGQQLYLPVDFPVKR